MSEPSSVLPARRRHLMNAATVLVVLAFAAWCAVSFHRDASDMHWSTLTDNWAAVLGVAGLSMVNYLLRAVRWHLYLSEFGHRLAWGYCWLTYTAGFAFTLSPGKIGEMMRARYYQAQAIPLARVTAAFFLERLMDLVAIIALCFFALASLGSNQHLIYAVGIVMLGLLATLALAPWQRWHDRRATAGGASAKVLQMFANARALLKPRILGAASVLSIVAWFAEGIGLKIIVDFISPTPLPWATCVGIYAIAVTVGALSFLPGGLGPTEAVMVTLLNVAGMSLSGATVATLVCRLLTLWFAVGLGWISVLMLRSKATPMKEAQA